MHLSLPIIASLLPLTYAVPFAVAPTNEQWQAAGSLHAVNLAASGSGDSSEVKLLRDAELFAAGPQAAKKVKVRRVKSNMDALERRQGHKKRACAAKPIGGGQALLAPAPSHVAVPSSSASVQGVTPAASSAAAEEHAAASGDAPVDSGSNKGQGVVSGLVDAIFPVKVKSRWTTAESEGDALSCESYTSMWIRA